MNIKKFKRGWIGGKTELIVSSQYGVYRKLSVYNGKTKKHRGIDISIPAGTNIYAPVGGTCSCKFEKDGAGLYLDIVSDGFKYRFFHMSETFIAKNTSSIVIEGQYIGKSGGKRGDVNSGSSTGPHLHFEIRKSPYTPGTEINPTNLFSDKLVSKNKQTTYNFGDNAIPLISDKTAVNAEDVKVEVDETNDNEASPDMSDADAIESNDIVEKEIKDELASGIWQITKLLVDKEVAGLRLYDVATSIHIGSLMSFFQKICQRPLVEFMGDTFGDQYYFIARKPPFDREGMLNALVNQGLFNESGNLDYSNNQYVIELKDVINTNLSFNSRNIYSWYQFYPVYEMGMSVDNNYNFLVPAVFFPEYAAIYGSREFKTISQYRNFHKSIKDELNDNNNSPQGNFETMNIIHDLKYIIESNAYNPFTRTGTIQIRGNRKIKRGMFILFNNQTNNSYLPEIFHVDSVSHDYSVTSSGVNRTTSIGVSHGMLIDYMFNAHEIELGDSKAKVSYFDLIDFGNYKKDNVDINSWQKIISTWKVNKDIFLFFLRKMQFINGVVNTPEIKSNVRNLFGF